SPKKANHHDYSASDSGRKNRKQRRVALALPVFPPAPWLAVEPRWMSSELGAASQEFDRALAEPTPRDAPTIAAGGGPRLSLRPVRPGNLPYTLAVNDPGEF